jgi:hypothetical protein
MVLVLAAGSLNPDSVTGTALHGLDEPSGHFRRGVLVGPGPTPARPNRTSFLLNGVRDQAPQAASLRVLSSVAPGLAGREKAHRAIVWPREADGGNVVHRM